MKKTILLLILCGSASLLYAQTDVILQQAQKYIANFDYKTAVGILEPEGRKKKARAETFEMLGDCYRALEDREKAIFYYEKRIEKEGTIPPNVLLQYGKLLIYEERYEEAKTSFEAYASTTPDTLAQMLIASCDTAMVWTAKKGDYNMFTVENLKRVNSKFHDWGAIYNKNGLVFISNRPRTKDGSDGFYTVYQSNYRKGNSFSAPTIFFNKMKEDIHTGPVAFTKNEKTIYYTQTNYNVYHRDKTADGTVWENKLEIIVAKINNKKLSSVKPFKYNNPRKYSVGHACVSPNDSILYYVSDMPGGFGGTDIYYSELETGGEWSAPVNAGAMINTAGNEMFPTMDSTGVLYFSSDGKIGLGGLDIFRAKGEKDQWSITENMHYPVNSSGDDLYFTLSPGGKSGFFASNRPDGVGGDDIYSFTLTRPLPDFGYMGNHAAYEKKLRLLEQENRGGLQGTVMNGVTHEGIDSVQISFVNNASKEQVICTTDSAGVFFIQLDKKENYTYSCIRKGYVPNIGQPLANTDTQIWLNGIHVEMTPVKMTGENVIAGNVILDTEQGKGIEYRVQLMARKEYPDWEYLDKAKEAYPNLKILYGNFPDFTRFTIGQFKTMKEATKLKNELRKIGYKDAFVVMFVNGKRNVVSYN